MWTLSLELEGDKERTDKIVLRVTHSISGDYLGEEKETDFMEC